jgi:hypothetical protein
MGRFGTALGVILAALVAALTFHYVSIDQARESLRRQLEDAATAAAIYNESSAECRAAESQGRMIVASWPVLWWEDGSIVRSHVAAGFDNMVALKRERMRAVTAPGGPPAKPASPTDPAARRQRLSR